MFLFYCSAVCNWSNISGSSCNDYINSNCFSGTIWPLGVQQFCGKNDNQHFYIEVILCIFINNINIQVYRLLFYVYWIIILDYTRIRKAFYRISGNNLIYKPTIKLTNLKIAKSWRKKSFKSNYSISLFLYQIVKNKKKKNTE